MSFPVFRILIFLFHTIYKPPTQGWQDIKIFVIIVDQNSGHKISAVWLIAR